MDKEIKKAYMFAKKYHGTQKDDEGFNYFEAHIVPVFNSISQLTDDCELRCAALLHDILEDTIISYDILKIEFGHEIADLVNEVTHEGSKEDGGYYFPRLHTKRGILLKLIDRASNISRMNNWSEKRQLHYLDKTKFWKTTNEKASGKEIEFCICEKCGKKAPEECFAHRCNGIWGKHYNYRCMCGWDSNIIAPILRERFQKDSSMHNQYDEYEVDFKHNWNKLNEKS